MNAIQDLKSQITTWTALQNNMIAAYNIVFNTNKEFKELRDFDDYISDNPEYKTKGLMIQIHCKIKQVFGDSEDLDIEKMYVITDLYRAINRVFFNANQNRMSRADIKKSICGYEGLIERYSCRNRSIKNE